MSTRFIANAVNEIRYYLADVDSPTTPVSTATVTVTITKAGTTIGSANRSMSYSSGLVVDTGKVGGYSVALTAAEITAAGESYQATITAVVSAVTVDTVVMTIPCVTNDGRG